MRQQNIVVKSSASKASKTKQENILQLNRIIGKPQDVDNDLICIICQDIVQDPQECLQCQALFCSSCLSNWLPHSQKCPNKCPAKFGKPHKKYIQSLYQLKFSCENMSLGCQDTVTFESVQIHQTQECKYMKKPSQSQQQIAQSQQQIAQSQQSVVQVVKNSKWYWKEVDNNWHPFNSSLISQFEDLLATNVTSFEYSINGAKYRLDQQTDNEFIQTNLRTNFARTVLRLMPENIQNGGLWVYSMDVDVNKLIDANICGMIDNNLEIFKSKGKPKKDTFCLNNGMIIQVDYTTMICTELDNHEEYELQRVTIQ